MATRRSDDSTLLPEGFMPGEMDVICSWARQNHEHAGNKQFRELIKRYSSRYMKATTKVDKTEVIAAVIEQVRSDSSKGGGFVKKDFYSGRWYEIGDEKARDKVGHAFRKAAELLNKEKAGSNTTPASKSKSKSSQSIRKGRKKMAKKQSLFEKDGGLKRVPVPASEKSRSCHGVGEPILDCYPIVGQGPKFTQQLLGPRNVGGAQSFCHISITANPCETAYVRGLLHPFQSLGSRLGYGNRAIHASRALMPTLPIASGLPLLGRGVVFGDEIVADRLALSIMGLHPTLCRSHSNRDV